MVSVFSPGTKNSKFSYRCLFLEKQQHIFISSFKLSAYFQILGSLFIRLSFCLHDRKAARFYVQVRVSYIFLKITQSVAIRISGRSFHNSRCHATKLLGRPTIVASSAELMTKPLLPTPTTIPFPPANARKLLETGTLNRSQSPRSFSCAL